MIFAMLFTSYLCGFSLYKSLISLLLRLNILSLYIKTKAIKFTLIFLYILYIKLKILSYSTKKADYQNMLQLPLLFKKFIKNISAFNLKNYLFFFNKSLISLSKTTFSSTLTSSGFTSSFFLNFANTFIIIKIHKAIIKKSTIFWINTP